MPASERQRELRRRRKRSKKLGLIKKRVEKANPTEKAEIASKLRAMTPGAQVLIDRMELEAN